MMTEFSFLDDLSLDLFCNFCEYTIEKLLFLVKKFDCLVVLFFQSVLRTPK